MGFLTDLRTFLKHVQDGKITLLPDLGEIDLQPMRMAAEESKYSPDRRYAWRSDELAIDLGFAFQATFGSRPPAELTEMMRVALQNLKSAFLDTENRGAAKEIAAMGTTEAWLFSKAVYDAHNSWLARTEAYLQPYWRYATELRLVRCSEGCLSLLSAGEVFLGLVGRDATRWLITLELLSSLDRDDEWRGHRSLAEKLIAFDELVLYDHERAGRYALAEEWPWENPALRRWDALGILGWEDFKDEGDRGVRVALTDTGAGLLGEFLAGPDTQLKVLARDTLDNMTRALSSFRRADDSATRTDERARYDTNEQIGEGAYGVVYRVTRETSTGPMAFALKELNLHPFTSDSGQAELRFTKEVQAIQRMQHRGIVTYLDAGVGCDGRPFLVMPLIDGRRYLEYTSTLRMEDRATPMIEVLRAIAHAHSCGVFHRDLKPSNVLVRKSDEQPIIVDFGQAYLLDHAAELSLTTTLIGSLGYIPPEVQANAKGSRSPQHDVYSCGVMLYESIAGSKPDPTNIRSLEAIEPALVELDSVVKCALATVEERYSDAFSFADELERAAKRVRDRVKA